MFSPFENAKWIFDSCPLNIKDSYFEFLSEFSVNKAENVTLYVSAYTKIAVFINGTYVPVNQYDDYEHNKTYSAIDVTPFVVAGKNAVEIGLYVCGENLSVSSKQTPGIIFAVFEGDRQALVSDENCLVRKNNQFLGNNEFYSIQLGYNFNFDSTKKQAAFHNASLVEKTKALTLRPIDNLSVLPVKRGTLCAQGVFRESGESLKAVRSQRAYLSSRYFSELCTGNKESFSWCFDRNLGDGAYFVFDFSGETVGYLEFSVTVPKKTEILLSFGEHLDDLRVRSHIGARHFCARFVAKKGKNTFFYPYMRWGLKYVQAFISSNKGSAEFFGIRPTEYPVKENECPSSDGLHRLLWRTGLKTLRSSMHDHYEDCPWREQSLYSLDSRIQMLCGYYGFSEYKFPASALKLMASSIDEKGFLQICAPGYMDINIPMFSIVFIRSVMEYTLASGDSSLKQELMPVLTRIAENFRARVNKDGLISQIPDMWNFYEWQRRIDGNMWKPKSVWKTLDIPKNKILTDCLLNAFACDGFACYASLSENESEKAQYLALSERIKNAVHKTFWREEFNGYASYSFDKEPQHTLVQAMMLFAGAVPKDKEALVVKLIKEKTLIPSSLSMKIFEYDALLNCSKDNLPFVINEVETVWGKMLAKGADTFWETEKGADDFGYAGSLCHGWSAVPVYILGKYFNKK